MDTLKSMRAFARVVECGSFTGAARTMNATPAFVSRAIAELEVHLRARLLHRTTRRIALTDAGARYLQRCERILADVEEAEAEAAGALMHPSGTLRVHAPPTLGQYFVAPAIARYKLLYPDVIAELTVGLDCPDLLGDRYDVAVQVATGDLESSGLVGVRLGASYSILCASPSYIERRGLPTDLGDLAMHACCDVVTPFFPVRRWTFAGPKGNGVLKLPADTFCVNNAEALTSALSEGIGIGALPIPNALQSLANGSLLHVLPEYRVQPVSLFALYASRHYLDARIGAWLKLLRHEVTERLAANESAISSLSS